MKISAIVPVYNTGHLLGRCLESILQQTFDEFEIIIINDGSPDNAQQIITDYEKKYPEKIRAISKENGGLPSARNYGLQYANGEYICFIDSDDYIEKNMFYELYKIATADSLEVVRGNFQNIYLNGKKEINSYFTDSKNSMTGKEYYIQEFNMLKENMKNMVWMSLYHRDLFFKKGIRFQEDPRIFEDIIFNAKIMRSVERIGTVNKPFYNYIQYDKSITNSQVVEKSQQTFLILAKELRVIATMDQDEKFSAAVHDYANYVGIFALKIAGREAYKYEELSKKISKHSFENETQFRKCIFRMHPVLFSYYLWLVEYSTRLKRKIIRGI